MKKFTILLLALTFMLASFTLSSAQTIGYAVQSDGDDQLYSIDLNTGVDTAIGPVGFADVEGLTFDSNGTLYGVDDATEQLITISLATGAGTVVGPLGVSITDMGLTFDSSGNLWMAVDAPSPETFYSINPATGAATPVGPQGQEVTGLAASGATVYGLGGDFTDNLVLMNTATGAATSVGPLVNVSLSDGGIDFDQSGILWGIADSSGDIFTINTSTGTATVVSTTTSGYEGLAISLPVAPTPVPSMNHLGMIIFTLLAGLGGVYFIRRKRIES